MNITEKKQISEKETLVESEASGEKSEKLLEITKVKTYFYTEEGVVKAVDGISFDIYQNEVLGLVGETGCGKSVTALSILRLVREPGKTIEGSIKYKGVDLLDLTETEMRSYRGKNITMIFQDPLNSLNPVISVGNQISEVFLLHQQDILKKELDERLLERKKKKNKKKELKKQLGELSGEELNKIQKEIKKLKAETNHIPVLKDVLLDSAANIIKEVGIADARGILKRYPHELSGGMRQRIMIAMALSCNPDLLIADEPTTALDVTIQAQILDLMKDLKKRFQTSILLITHDLGIIADLCDRVAVMYSGSIVEYATAFDLFKNPRHPYTQGLIESIPSIEKKNQKLKTIRGMVPNLIYPPAGCRFHPRCDKRLEICDSVRPNFLEISNRYYIACHLFDPKYKDSPKFKWEEEEFKLSEQV